MNSTLVNNPSEVYAVALSSCSKAIEEGANVTGLTDDEKSEMGDSERVKALIDLALEYENKEFMDPVSGDILRVFYGFELNGSGLSLKDQFASIFLGDRSLVKRAFFYHCLVQIEKYIDNNSHSNIAGEVMEIVEGIKDLGRKSKARLRILALRHLDYVLFHSKVTVCFMDLKENRPEDASSIDEFLSSEFFKKKYERTDVLLGFTPMEKVRIEDVLADFEKSKL